MTGKSKVPEPDFSKQCQELHDYLLSKLDHNWRLDTWKDKYKSRLRVYGLEKCKRAIDGFCHPLSNWYMRNVSHKAPDLIFRSDKALETFLAKAPEIHEDNNQAEQDRIEKVTDYRKKLEKGNRELTTRFFRKIRDAGLKDEINPHAWNCWIKPLLVVGMINGTVVLFHEQPSWVQEHYAGKIEEAIGTQVRIVNQTEGS